MLIALSPEAMEELRGRMEAYEDAECTGENEYVIDLYDAEKPMSLQLAFEKNGVNVLAAEYLAFDEELDGWYLCAPVDDADAVTSALCSLPK